MKTGSYFIVTEGEKECIQWTGERGEPGFNQEPYLRTLALGLIDYGATAFVETGTLWGNTCNWIARRRDLPIFTCEIRPSCLECARENCVSGIKIYEMSSEEFIPYVIADAGSLPLFYLDAHGSPEYWPIQDEIIAIGKHCNRAYILIHDFEVPNNPSFGFQVQGGNRLNLDYIKSSLSPNHIYKLFLPNYTSHPRKQGYALLFQNATPCGPCVESNRYMEWKIDD